MARKSIKYYAPYIFSALLFLLIVVPVFYLFFIAVFQYPEMLSKFLAPINFLLIVKSILIAFITAFLATSIGSILGLILYKTQLRNKNFYLFILLLPLLLPPYVMAVAWKDVWYLWGAKNSNISILQMIFVQTIIYFPLAMLITGNAFSQINKSIDEAGLIVLNKKNVIRKIIFPLVKPALSISFILIFIFSIGDFSVPSFFGIQTFTTEIFTQFSAFYNYPFALSQSILLMLIALALLLSEKKYLSDLAFFSMAEKGNNVKKYGVNQIVLQGILLIISAIIIYPFLVLFYQAMQGNHNFQEAFFRIIPGFKQSFLLAFLGAILIVSIGLISAYYKERKKFSLPNTLLLIAFIVPSTVYGIGLIGYYNQAFFNLIYASKTIIIIGYVGSFSFIASRIIGNAFKQIPKSMGEIADLMGISAYQKFKSIVFPLLTPAIFAAFVLAFILSINELGVSILIYPPGTKLFPIRLFTLSANAPLSIVSGMTFIILIVNLIFILLFYFIGKKLFNNNYYG